MAWLDLMVPSAAILALFGVVALLYVAIRQGRHIRRLEQRLADRGEASIEAPLQRIAELQAREKVSSGRPQYTNQLRTAGVIALAAIALVLAIGGLWYLFVRDDGSASASGSTPSASTTVNRTTANPPKPVDQTIVPANVPALPDKSSYTVAVFNASGVSGAAGEKTAPRLTAEGWNVGMVANEPNDDIGRQESVVMYTRGKRNVAWNVAKDLGIKRAPPVDGYTPDQYGNADVIVLVGLDLANGGTTPSP
ncbi:MAG TPA: LytR C-terminal domain-containing protein [Miltoncostaea sp.]|nr:LytR C-terminal domain-containing protein [Miltoncostaea sp.]